jgi:hypothetical protein
MIRTEKRSSDRAARERCKRYYGEGHSKSRTSLGDIVAQTGDTRWEHTLPACREHTGENSKGIETSSIFDSEPTEYQDCVDEYQWQENVHDTEPNNEDGW